MGIDDPVPASRTTEQTPGEGKADSQTAAQHAPPTALEESIPQQTPNQRMIEVIEHSNARLASSSEWLEHSQIRVKSALGQVQRNQTGMERSKPPTARKPNPPADTQPRRSPRAVYDPDGLRERLAELASTFAETEDSIARYHDQLAADNPVRADDSRRIAEKAREGARRAREIADHFRD